MRRAWLAATLAVGTVGSARAEDRTVKRDPFDATVAARYKALSTGIAIPLYARRKTTYLVGVAHRTEIRYGEHRGWDTLGIAGDLTLEAVPKSDLPVALGLRLEQAVSESRPGTTVLFELCAGLYRITAGERRCCSSCARASSGGSAACR